ncbi:hypothetical protein BGZ50_001968 [Haplosporangium sp. Z 11]|nr:hypothetical protein BGZ50_001968 [Haplosporangium sp. Z 11]
MGIPIDLPSPDSPTFRPTHSAKPSWSNQSGNSLYHLSNSQTPSSSSSSVRLQLAQNTRSYEPSSSTSIWGTSMSSPLAQSPVSFTSPTFPHSHPEHPSAIHGAFVEQSSSHTTSMVAPHMGTDQRLSGAATTETEIESPLRMRAHPNLRRVTRMPAFITTASASAAHSSSQTMAAGTVLGMETLTSNAHGLSALTTSSLAHHQTRPLPPPPSPPQSSGSRTSLTGNSASGRPHSQQREESSAQDEASSWNYRFINRNHADNRGRIEGRRLSDRALDGYYYEDVRLRHENSGQDHHQHYHHHFLTQQDRSAIITAASSVRTPEVIRGHDVYENGADYQRRYLGHQSRQHHQREYGRELGLGATHASSVLVPSSHQNTMRMDTIPSYLQDHPGTTRTIIRADPVLPGVIHIYPEDHAPIWMYGRPILSSSPTRNASASSINNCNNNSNFISTEDISYPSAGTDMTPSSPAGSSRSMDSANSLPSLSPDTMLPSPASPASLSLQDSSGQQQAMTGTRASFPETFMVSNPILSRPPSASLSPAVATGELFRFAPLTSISFPSSIQQESPRMDENNTPLDDYTQMSVFATVTVPPTSTSVSASASVTTALNITTTETTRPPPRHDQGDDDKHDQPFETIEQEQQ